MVIRKAGLKDSGPIADCLLLAMEDIVYSFIGEQNLAKANDFMLHFVQMENNQYSWQNCWVAEDEGKVVAAVVVYDGGKLKELRQPVLDFISNRFKKDLDPDDETQAGEYYIDTLGVNPGHQGKGIGSQIIKFLIEEYVNKRGEVLGLLVDEENPNAKKLYIKSGFKIARKRLFLGKKVEHLQIKP